MVAYLKIAIAETSIMLRCGLENMLKHLPGLHIQIIDIGHNDILLEALKLHKPDILIINPLMPGFANTSVGQLRDETGLPQLKCIALLAAIVPDELVIDLVKERLEADDAQKGFILDGFPRNTAQAVTLDSELSAMGRTLDAALLVSVEPEVIVERLSSRRTCRACGYTAPAGVDTCPRCGGEMYQRDDDKPETIQHRLDVYQSQTAPLIEYYRGHSILKEVDGDRPVDEVYADVKVLLGL